MQASQQTASLVKRLAGPSTGKAGLAHDQSEINKIIAEVSKGSKFYEREKQKDKELTAKIESILALRESLVAGADLPKIEAKVDQLLLKLKEERDLSQTIVHFDLDSFFASVEVLNNPSLAGKAFAVGHSVISTASYEARKYGVRSGMATFIAKKLCPQLLMVDHGALSYSEMSGKVMAICERYDPQMCPAGCDEGYLNITAYCLEHDMTPDDAVQHLRSAVFEETKLTVSAGIAPNLMLAKICSDKNKPNGQYHLPFSEEAVMDFMRNLPIRKIPGIGRVTERTLESIGIKTCGDIYTHRATLSLMDKQFGLVYLLQKHLGIASNHVQPPERDERKSIGAERTFAPLSDKEKIIEKLYEVCAELEADMEQTQWAGRTITLKYKLDTFEVSTRAKTLDRFITRKDDLFAIGHELLLAELPLTIRLIGIRVTKLKDLREPKSPVGIKRFFEAVGPESPSKKRKVEDPDDDDLAISISDKPLSTSSKAETHPCPVCGKRTLTENDAFNRHLDDCLSRDAIREAHAEAQPGKPPSKPGNLLEQWTNLVPKKKKIR
ncbi:IMS-domain-containing protein [Mycena indigotica]|uniref:DNA polymerase kappa n=1 Tax=Mycena indigotica TaxID=2126181 RepID=A0A8H6TET5_9AGAR|nr:IMS-domain-containing protein [Mycena indigotica]KAF7315401.1 IMS-domain-containing protein [Mycena indigotica]